MKKVIVLAGKPVSAEKRAGDRAGKRRSLLGGLSAVVCSTVIFCGLMQAAQAQTTDEIRKRGVIRVGVLAGEPPWGFANEKGEPVGVDIDVAELIAKDLGVKVEYERVLVSSRIPALMTSKVDVLIASMGMFPERAKVVQFSRPYVANVNMVVASKDKPIASYADLKPYKVGVNRGNIIDVAVTKNAPSGTEILRFDDDASAVQALRSGQVDAIGLALYPLRMLDKTAPGHDYEKKIVVNNQWTGIAMRKNQKELNTYLNGFLDKLEKNGELNRISQKWLNTDHPPFPTSIPEIPFTVE
jgi:polar amino acid transport system substrate-binding protein